MEALKIAKNKASDYAMAIDQKIGNAIHIEEKNNVLRSEISNNSSVIQGYSYIKDKKFSPPNFQKIMLSTSIFIKFKLIQS